MKSLVMMVEYDDIDDVVEGLGRVIKVGGKIRHEW